MKYPIYYKKTAPEMKEDIIGMLEYANERELRLIYVFANGLIDFDRTPEQKTEANHEAIRDKT